MGFSSILTAADQIESLIRQALTSKDRLLVAIDGRCGSGKSTLADELSSRLSASVIHADDFFLRPEQRTKERLAEVGGNLDRDRLAEEVLRPLQEGRPLVYAPFDCSTQSLQAPIALNATRVVILEGSYCCHPDLWDYADLHIFATVPPDEQMRRILVRNGDIWAQQFAQQWIPLEERYFDRFSIPEKADLIVEL